MSNRDDSYEIYVMELREAGSGEMPRDDGDIPATAIPLGVGESIESELSAGEIDYFRVTVSSAGTLIASTTGSTDTYGSIRDSSGSVLNEDDDSGADHNFHVSAGVEPGTYYIRVRGYDDSSTGAYTLTLQATGAIRRLTNHPDRYESPSWSPEGRHIAFISDSGGPVTEEIYVMDSDGSNLRRLTNNSVWDASPSWSPNGRHIAFVSGNGDNKEIYVMDSDGSNLRRLTNNSVGDYSPSWSPDGRYIAFISARNGFFTYDVYVMDSDGSNPRNLTNHSASDASPSWSPDGRHIAFMSDRAGNEEIYVMDSDGSNPRRLTTGGGASPLWSPDGRHIAFLSYRDGVPEIYVMGLDGSNLLRLTHNSAWDGDPSWSPDGRYIAFMSNRDGNWEIYVMGLDGSNLRNLTNHRARDGSPSWSPDGRHIAFHSYRDSGSEIYVMEFRPEDGGGTPRTERESPFNIDLVFLDYFTEEEQELWHQIARHWELAIETEFLEYTFSTELIGEGCGDHSIRISADEQIDGLRIYITKFDEIDHLKRRANGWGGPMVRRRSSSMPIIGCVGIDQNISRVDKIWNIGLHEIGHVLGIGSFWEDSGMLRDLNGDPHFAGPQAIAAFNQAGGTNYQGAKVPTEQDGGHWRSSVLSGELMTPIYSDDNVLSAITLGALSDLGYSVNFSAADPYVLPPPTTAKPVAGAVPFCSLEGLPAPVYVDD